MMKKFKLSLRGVIGLVAALGCGAVMATPINGTDSILTDPALGTVCGAKLAVGVTCNNNTSLSGTGMVIWDGGATGQFVIAGLSGTLASDTQLTSSVGDTYTFTSADGSFTGVILSATPGGSGNNLSLTDILQGTFTPAGLTGAFTPGAASLTMAYTETINSGSGLGTFSVSETLASSPISETVPEPATLTLLGLGLAGLGLGRRWKRK